MGQTQEKGSRKNKLSPGSQVAEGGREGFSVEVLTEPEGLKVKEFCKGQKTRRWE
jgi:hypothetical protein